MYVCMYVCLYVCMYVCRCMCMCICMGMYMYMYMCMYMYTYIRICTCLERLFSKPTASLAFEVVELELPRRKEDEHFETTHQCLRLAGLDLGTLSTSKLNER